MSGQPSSPLLGSANRPNKSNNSHEAEPLLSRSDDTTRYDGSEDADEGTASPAASSLRSMQNGHTSTKSDKGGRRWPTIVAISVLGAVAIAIIFGAFFAPAIVEEYAREALVIEPTNLSIDSFTKTGVNARIQANFKLDASRVRNKNVRDVGRFGTWVAREIHSQSSTVEVYLPEYGNILIGTAAVPPITVDIRNGHTTGIDITANLEPGNIEGIRQVANDWLDGRLQKVKVTGKANVGLKTGLIYLGTQSISESLVFEENDIPKLPQYNITRLEFNEVPIPPAGKPGMAADVSLSLVNSYPVKFTIPSLGFDILVPNCDPSDSYIHLADATTDTINVEPKSDLKVHVAGTVSQLPPPLLQHCPNNDSSPLDLLLDKYIRGRDTTVYVRGSSQPSENTPDWLRKIISSVTVPVPFPGHTFDNVIKNFSLTDTHFSLPDPTAPPNSDEQKPQISGSILVLAGLPKELNFGLNVTEVRATAGVLYKGKKLGDLDLKKWQRAQSRRVKDENDEGADIEIKSRIENAPLDVTDNDVFSSVLEALFFGKPLVLTVDALVDVKVTTVLGEVIVKKMPANGVVPIKPISTGGGFADVKPRVDNLRILSTSKTRLEIEARVNFTNPTEYTAHVPYVNIHILNNGSVLGDAIATNVDVVQGDNLGMIVKASWDPTTFGGDDAKGIGRELLSQYISGFNTTLTFRTHENSIPYQPSLGETLSKFEVEIPTPRLRIPSSPGNDDSDDGGAPHFIDNAVFHLWSSTAEFTLLSPLQYTTIFVTSINATAYYNHTEPVGHIDYDLPFKVTPGRSTSPRLPVQWSLDSVGYDKIRKALGGELRLDARGDVKIRVGNWNEEFWYLGHGIGAEVRI